VKVTYLLKEEFMNISPHYKNAVPPENIKLLIITEAPPLQKENYFYNVTKGYKSHDSSRSFFRGIMQGIGLLPIGISVYDEEVLLNAFLKEGYFLIDSCPLPLVDKIGKQLPGNNKRRIMVNYAKSLFEIINSLNPDNILFVCSTNDVVMEKLPASVSISERLLTSRPLPYPGVGWLRRPDKKGFINLLPENIRLAAIY
jgi:hypothetical protein